MCGLVAPPIDKDETWIIQKCQAFFKLVQFKWISRLSKQKGLKDFEIQESVHEWNMVDGGVVSIFELLSEFRKATRDYPRFQQRVIKNLKPDHFFERDQMTSKAWLEFSILKIIIAVAKKGLSIPEIFARWDTDKSGFCKSTLLFTLPPL